MCPFRLGSGQREGHTEGAAAGAPKKRTKARLHAADTDSDGVVWLLYVSFALMRTQANKYFVSAGLSGAGPEIGTGSFFGGMPSVCCSQPVHIAYSFLISL